MLASSIPLVWRLVIYLCAGVGAGIANGIAGGGTFITFPTLLAMGASALEANVTTTVGVVRAMVIVIGALTTIRLAMTA